MSPAKLKLINTMKLKTLLIGCFGGFIMLNSCTESPSVKDYSAYVNPFIGTGGHGHTFPGAVVPHGMIQPSPLAPVIITTTTRSTDFRTLTSAAPAAVTTETYY